MQPPTQGKRGDARLVWSQLCSPTQRNAVVLGSCGTSHAAAAPKENVVVFGSSRSNHAVTPKETVMVISSSGRNHAATHPRKT
jgi:hypothetical protein